MASEEKREKFECTSSDAPSLDEADEADNRGEVEEPSTRVLETPLPHEIRLDEDGLKLYLSESRQFQLLDAKAEKQLGSRIELGKYLSQVERDWRSRHGAIPSDIDIVLTIGESLVSLEPVFEALLRHLGVEPTGPVGERMLSPSLRSAIDGSIDTQLAGNIAQSTGSTPSEIERKIIELSLVSQLIPWQLMGEAAQKSTLREFGETLHSPEFISSLDSRRTQVHRHFRQIREGAQRATDDMVRANLRLVIAMARKNMGKGMPLLDLIQEGNIGLITAADKFDHRLSYKFSTYATWWIRQAITRSIADQSRTVRLPVHMVETLTRLYRASQQFSQEHGRAPTREELAEEVHLPGEKIEELVEAGAIESISLDTPVGEAWGEGHVADFIADQRTPSPEEETARELLRAQLKKILESLPERERRVIELRFGLEDGRTRTLEEVATEFGVTRERIRQIEQKALSELRHPSRSHLLKDYLR